VKIWLVGVALLLAGCESVTGSVAPTPPPVVVTPSPSPTPWVFDPSKVTYIYPASTPAPVIGTPLACKFRPEVIVVKNKYTGDPISAWVGTVCN
jgi:hypothetical protein